MESLENRLKIRKLLAFSEIKELCFREAKLEKYEEALKDVIFEDRDRYNAHYDCVECVIGFNMSKMVKNATEFANIIINSSGLSSRNRNIYANIMILNTIYHELRHAFQMSTVYKSSIDKFELYLMLMNDIIMELSPRKFYYDNYNCFPAERDAMISAALKVLKIIGNLDLEPKELIEFQTKLLLLLVSEYEFSTKEIDKGVCQGPFLTLLKQFGDETYKKNKRKINLSISKYSAYDRVRLGLPITLEERNKYGNMIISDDILDVKKIITIK